MTPYHIKHLAKVQKVSRSTNLKDKTSWDWSKIFIFSIFAIRVNFLIDDIIWSQNEKKLFSVLLIYRIELQKNISRNFEISYANKFLRLSHFISTVICCYLSLFLENKAEVWRIRIYWRIFKSGALSFLSDCLNLFQRVRWEKYDWIRF